MRKTNISAMLWAEDPAQFRQFKDIAAEYGLERCMHNNTPQLIADMQDDVASLEWRRPAAGLFALADLQPEPAFQPRSRSLPLGAETKLFSPPLKRRALGDLHEGRSGAPTSALVI